MPAPMAPLLTVAVASSALFDLRDGEAIFRSHGRSAYAEWVRAREAEPPAPGAALPFIRRLLAVNAADPSASTPLVEVVLISRNDPDTGVRVRSALEHYRLPIARCAFTGGSDPWPYAAAFDAALFLSASRADVEAGLAQGMACGLVLPGSGADDPADLQLRIAFDFDGVLASDEAERVYHEHGLDHYREAERGLFDQPLAPGPLQALLRGLARVQEAEAAGLLPPVVRTAIITARSAPADRRVVTTLRAWGVRVDESYFVGDLPKDRIIKLFKPHIFFDDKRANAELAATCAPSVHIPFGVLNRP